MKALDGTFFTTGKIARPVHRIKTTWVVPDNIPARNIKYHLCKAGPKQCAECQLCEWGKCYLRMKEAEEKKNLTSAMLAVV